VIGGEVNDFVRVSLQHIAQRAGVSRVTASNVVRGRHAQMSAATRERVLAAMKELQYVPVPPPSLQSRHVDTRIIGLVFDDVFIEDRWGLAAFRGMRERGEEIGYDLLTLLRSPDRWVLDRQELRFLDRRSDGFIFVVPLNRQALFDTLVRYKIPVATCFTADAPEGVATVTLDNEGSMRRATEYLIERGHKRIVHLSGGDVRTDFRSRRTGYELAMAEGGLTARVVTIDRYCGAKWKSEFNDMLRKKLRPTAIVAYNDGSAMIAMQLAQQRGLQIPGDLSITGMDDLPETAALGLTTFRFSSEEVGRRAVDGVVKLLGGADSREASSVVPVDMVERSSVASL
jgi:DNA-binding LacI/PurR family transcriptional regulator